MPQKDSTEHSDPEAQCPGEAVQSTVPQRGCTKQCPRRALHKTVPKKGSAEHSAPDAEAVMSTASKWQCRQSPNRDCAEKEKKKRKSQRTAVASSSA